MLDGEGYSDAKSMLIYWKYLSEDWKELEALEEIPEINGVYKKSSDDFSYYIIDNSGNLYAWGDNHYGQLGIGNTENQLTPVQITGVSNIVDVYTDGYSVIAKDNSGNLYAWGDNSSGELGIGNTEDQLSPVQIQGISDIVYIYMRFFSNSQR